MYVVFFFIENCNYLKSKCENYIFVVDNYEGIKKFYLCLIKLNCLICFVICF